MKPPSPPFLPSLLAMSFLAAGCATLTGQKKEPYMIYSTPPGASVTVDGVPMGTTPVTVQIAKKGKLPSIELDVPGQPPQACHPRHRARAGYVVADIILCLIPVPILGCISFIDAAGAWNHLVPNSCFVHFANGPADLDAPAPPGDEPLEPPPLESP